MNLLFLPAHPTPAKGEELIVEFPDPIHYIPPFLLSREALRANSTSFMNFTTCEPHSLVH